MDSRVVVRFGRVVAEFIHTGGNDDTVSFVIDFHRQRAPAALVWFGSREAFESISAPPAVVGDANACAPGSENHSVPAPDGEGGLRRAVQIPKIDAFTGTNIVPAKFNCRFGLKSIQRDQ